MSTTLRTLNNAGSSPVGGSTFLERKQIMFLPYRVNPRKMTKEEREKYEKQKRESKSYGPPEGKVSPYIQGILRSLK